MPIRAAQSGHSQTENGSHFLANTRGKVDKASHPNDSKLTRNIINDTDIDNIYKGTERTDYSDFIPQTQDEQLAIDMATALDDYHNLPLYLSYARKYPHPLLWRAHGEARQMDKGKIRKSRGAVFNHLVQKYAKTNKHDSRD